MIRQIHRPLYLAYAGRPYGRRMPYTVIACRSALVLVFGVAVLGKVSGPRAFAEFEDMLRAMRLVPARLRRPTAVIVIGLESAVPVVLLAGTAVRIGFLGAAVLMALFVGGTAVVIRRRTPVSCRCFGPGGGRLGYPHLVRDGLIAAIATVGLIGAWIDPGPAEHPGGIAVGVLAGLTAAALLVRFDELVDLFAARTA